MILAAAMLLAGAAPAIAQGYTGWIEHPYPLIGQWDCEWFEDGGQYDGWSYWCYDPNSTRGVEGWVRMNPDWYDIASYEMMRVYGQPVL